MSSVCDFHLLFFFQLTVRNGLNKYVFTGFTGPPGNNNLQSRARTSLVVVLVFTGVSTLLAIGYFLYKRSPIPLIALPPFENPLYFDGEPSQPDVVDTNKLMAKEEESSEQFITL